MRLRSDEMRKSGLHLMALCDEQLDNKMGCGNRISTCSDIVGVGLGAVWRIFTFFYIDYNNGLAIIDRSFIARTTNKLYMILRCWLHFRRLPGRSTRRGFAGLCSYQYLNRRPRSPSSRLPRQRRYHHLKFANPETARPILTARSFGDVRLDLYSIVSVSSDGRA